MTNPFVSHFWQESEKQVPLEFHREGDAMRKAVSGRGPLCPGGGTITVVTALRGWWRSLSHGAFLRLANVVFEPVVRSVIGNHGHPKPQRLVKLVGCRERPSRLSK
jgi:hypothetical protein